MKIFTIENGTIKTGASVGVYTLTNGTKLSVLTVGEPGTANAALAKG